MRYGGHQTFFIREGWMYKATKLLIEDPDKLTHEFAADYLGVGRNMAMAINHWLLATKLATKEEGGSRGLSTKLASTSLARNIFSADPYFSELSTWWVLHLELVNNPDHAATWHWFFMFYLRDRFEKSSALEALRTWQSVQKGSVPSSTTLDRDLLVFLSSYSKSVPPRAKDPEEEIDSPFRDLGLMTHFRTSGYYQLNRIPRKFDPGVILYALNLALPEEEKPQGMREVTMRFSDLTRLPKAPTKSLVLTNEGLLNALLDCEAATSGEALKVRGLAGERQIVFKGYRDPIAALLKYTFVARAGTAK